MGRHKPDKRQWTPDAEAHLKGEVKEFREEIRKTAGRLADLASGDGAVVTRKHVKAAIADVANSGSRRVNVIRFLVAGLFGVVAEGVALPALLAHDVLGAVLSSLGCVLAAWLYMYAPQVAVALPRPK